MELDLVLTLFATPWIILALFAAFGDSLVGYIDEWLLSSLKEERSEVEPPGKLLLISGFFGVVTSLIVFVVSLFIPDLLNVPAKGLSLAIIAGFLEVLWLIPYFHALHRSGALSATPILQSVPIFAGLLGLFFYNEIPSGLQAVGAILILGGALFLNYSKETKKLSFVTIGLMLIASLIIACGMYVFKDSALTGNIAAAIFGNGIGMFLMSTFIWMVYKPYRVQFNQFIRMVKLKTVLTQSTNECLYTLSTIAGQYALVLGPSVMVVSAFNAFHPLFTLAIAFVLSFFGVKAYRDRLHGREIITKSLGIFLIVGGVLLLV